MQLCYCAAQKHACNLLKIPAKKNFEQKNVEKLTKWPGTRLAVRAVVVK